MTMAIRMKPAAMNGTTTSAKLAMRLTPPKIPTPRSRATTMPMPSFRACTDSMPKAWPSSGPHSAVPRQALMMLSAMALACTPGIRKPAAMIVAMAKASAYHFRPMAFSM
ncbi:hypothetical protein G6F50_017552 [Rhizopus delemar]|uniref:Uncharacterized protein n=1 Tax=Rhizopus delemar TaxID=936053 RepID=A0A9P7C0F1_9FUNG|nr:hypothetical protein G6F50_017552 [Rhizopus delemar]